MTTQAQIASQLRAIRRDLLAPFGEGDFIPGAIEDAAVQLDELAAVCETDQLDVSTSVVHQQHNARISQARF